MVAHCSSFDGRGARARFAGRARDVSGGERIINEKQGRGQAALAEGKSKKAQEKTKDSAALVNR
ncbi:MAG: hypothetical protein DMF65_02770 [Acidobacteria bacterium]|nr:MAG: hypothetical protein DMF65_02770 [Acidobacteriota bacterium]